MLNTVKHYTSVALYFAKLSLQGQMEYPLFLMSWLIMVPIQWFAGIYMLQLLVYRFHALKGWGFPQLAFLYGLSILSHGLMVTLFVRTWNMDRFVVNGEFDRMFLRPLNVFFQLSVSFVNLIGTFDLIPGIIIFVYGCKQVNFIFSFENIVLLFLVVIGGVLIRTAFYLIVGTISFWTKRSFPLTNMGITLMQYGTTYPLSIYPYIIQVLLTFLLPIGFISFYPASEFLGLPGSFVFPVKQSLLTVVAGIVFFAVSQLFFRIGLKNYESSGS